MRSHLPLPAPRLRAPPVAAAATSASHQQHLHTQQLVQELPSLVATSTAACACAPAARRRCRCRRCRCRCRCRRSRSRLLLCFAGGLEDLQPHKVLVLLYRQTHASGCCSHCNQQGANKPPTGCATMYAAQ